MLYLLDEMNDDDKPKSGPAFPRVTGPVFRVPISPVQAVEGVGRCAPANYHRCCRRCRNLVIIT